jgi:amino acid adenylation domain-containing protein
MSKPAHVAHSARRSPTENSTENRAEIRTRPKTFLDRFWGHVLDRSDHEALVDDSTKYSYAKLGQKVTDAAANLRSLGVAPRTRVGLFVERNVDAIVAVLAILEVGATYVPIDLRVPEERLEILLQNADLASVVIGQDISTEALELFKKHTSNGVICAVDLGKAPREYLTTERNKSSDIAYVIYTSGSTGAPKGVPISHGNLFHLLRSWDHVLLRSPYEKDPRKLPTNTHRSLLLSSLSFDASIAELFWPLASGGTLVVAPDASRSVLDLAVGERIKTHGVTHMQCTPTRATLMLADDEDRLALQHIRHLVIGGEAVPTVLARELLQSGVGRLTNAYGPTEATVWATTCEIDATLMDSSPAICPIGSPLRDVSVAIVGPDGQPVFGTQTGELILGGPFVSKGYFRNPDRTQTQFGRFDFQGRLLHGYRTGDLVSRRTDGHLDFHGRADQQVKIRGHRIELGEIEAILATDATVQQAAVSLDPDVPNQLVAFLVARVPNSISPEDLGNRLRRRLPEVMIPSRYIVVDDLPKTTSEKVDRETLASLLRTTFRAAEFRPDAQLDRAGLRQLAFDIADPVALLAEDFATVLDKQIVLPSDDFFALGGHSLQVVELLARIEQRTGLRVPIRTILVASTPRDLAARIALQSVASSTAHPGGSQGHQASPHAAVDDQTRTNLAVRFRPRSQGRERTLYLIHGAAGNVVRFRGLAQSLQDLVEIVGIQCAGLEGETLPDQTLAEMVLRYADVVEHDSSSKTVELGGYSAGGIVALHLAAELKRRGMTVRSFVLLDSFEANVLPSTITKKLRVLTDNVRHRQGLPLQRFLRTAAEGWKRRASWDRAGTEAALTMGYRDLFDHNVKLMQNVRSAPLAEAPALLLRCSIENPFRKRTYEQALRCPSQTTEVWIDAKHDELITGTNVAEIQVAMRTFLRRV